MVKPADIAPKATLRLDKWLWQARFFKTRTLASGEVQAGHLRVNGVRVSKAASAVGAGDVLTFAQGDRVRLIRVAGLGMRRGRGAQVKV